MSTTSTKKQSYKQTVLEFIKDNYEVSPIEIITRTGISQQTVHNNLKLLIEEELVEKKGSGVNVVYLQNSLIARIEKIKKKKYYNLVDIEYDISNSVVDTFSVLEDSFVFITPNGQRFDGFKGFSIWCKKHNIDRQKTINEYLKTVEKYNKFLGKNNLIDATKKFQLTFPDYNDLEKVYYYDFYTIKRFGKTKLGNLMFYGKQSQNLKLIKEVTEIIKPKILQFIKDNNINAVAFVPPTINREVQFMNILRQELNLNISVIKLKKLVNDIAVQQKTIKFVDDRISNAENIVVEMNPKFENVLILDDAVGSGSTFAVVAKKLRLKKVAIGKIFAIAIVGSPNGVIDNQKKGFEVINEV